MLRVTCSLFFSYFFFWLNICTSDNKLCRELISLYSPRNCKKYEKSLWNPKEGTWDMSERWQDRKEERWVWGRMRAIKRKRGSGSHTDETSIVARRLINPSKPDNFWRLRSIVNWEDGIGEFLKGKKMYKDDTQNKVFKYNKLLFCLDCAVNWQLN